MADVTLKYKGATIGELSESGSKTIETAGKYCEADILLEYVKSSNGLKVFTRDIVLNQDTITPTFDLGIGAGYSDGNLWDLRISGAAPTGGEQAVFGIKQYRPADGEVPSFYETANRAILVASGSGGTQAFAYSDTGLQTVQINVNNGVISCSTVSKVWRRGTYHIIAVFKENEVVNNG